MEDRLTLQGLYKQDRWIQDIVRTLFTCNKALAEHEDIGTAICLDPDDHQYEFAGWPLRDIGELADYCRRALEGKLKNDHNLFLDLATNDTEREIMEVCEQMVASGERVRMTEEEFRAMDKRYNFPRS